MVPPELSRKLGNSHHLVSFKTAFALGVWLLLQSSSAPAAPFLRGDANRDGAVDISDMAHAIASLFLGGPEPDCGDAADLNDDGTVDLSDPVHGLHYLFLNQASPPAPGALIPGFDETPDDPFLCGDPPFQDCLATASSTLPGVSFDLSGNPCTLTLAQAASGVQFRYRTVVEEDISDVRAFPGCFSSDQSGLGTREDISGEEQRFCFCDCGFAVGCCVSRQLTTGVYENRFWWNGRNWIGPSDFGNPFGPPFPPGTYRFSLRAGGTHPGEPGERVPFEVRASIDFHLVP